MAPVHWGRVRQLRCQLLCFSSRSQNMDGADRRLLCRRQAVCAGLHRPGRSQISTTAACERSTLSLAYIVACVGCAAPKRQRMSLLHSIEYSTCNTRSPRLRMWLTVLPPHPRHGPARSQRQSGLIGSICCRCPSATSAQRHRRADVYRTEAAHRSGVESRLADSWQRRCTQQAPGERGSGLRKDLQKQAARQRCCARLWTVSSQGLTLLTHAAVQHEWQPAA